MANPEPGLVRVLSGETVGPPPIWLMRQAGRYLPEYRDIRSTFEAFLDLCYAPERAAEVTLQPIKRFDFDAAILFSDILVVPDALGQPVWFESGEGPRLEPVATMEDIAALDGDRAITKLSPIFETVARVREELDSNKALIGFCGGPWTVATYMAGGRGSPDQKAARLWAYREPKVFSQLIELLVGISAGYLIGQLKAGADVVQIFDSWAANLGDGEFERWIVEPNAKIVAAVRRAVPDAKIIGFPRGSGLRSSAYAAATGVDGLGLDTTVPVDFAARELQPTIPVQGNLDPLALVAGGAALDEGIDRIVAALGDGPLIFNLGHGIVPETPIEHVARLVDRVRNGG